MPLETIEYEGVVKYAANRELREGRITWYHDAKITIYTDDGDEDVRVFAEEGDDEHIEDLLELKVGDNVDIIGKEKSSGGWKYYLAHWMDEEREPSKPKRPSRAPARAASRGAPKRSERPTKHRTPERDAPTTRPARIRQLSPPTLPDEEGNDAMLEAFDHHAAYVHRAWASLDREFAAEPENKEDELKIKPGEESLKGMALAIYISFRDNGWL